MKRRDARREVQAAAPRPPLLPDLPKPLRYALGMGLLTFCLWLPSFIALFTR